MGAGQGRLRQAMACKRMARGMGAGQGRAGATGRGGGEAMVDWRSAVPDKPVAAKWRGLRGEGGGRGHGG